MSCTNCTTRILRSLLTDITPATTARTTSTAPRRLTRLTPRTAIRHTSSTAPRHQSADLSSSSDASNSSSSNASGDIPSSSTDFLGMYSTAKRTANKEALATWSSSWKTETDLSAMRDHAIRLPDSGNHNSKISNNNNNTGLENDDDSIIESSAMEAAEMEDDMEEIEYLDDFTSLPSKPKGKNNGDERISLSPSSSSHRSGRGGRYKEDLDRIPPTLKSQFPTRSSNSSSNTKPSTNNNNHNNDEIPWENSAEISKKMKTPHNPTANAWKEWSTPALWSHARMQELYKPKTTDNGIRITKFATLHTNTGVLNWNPQVNPNLSLDRYKAAAGVPINTAQKVYDKDTPAWKIHKDAVREKLKNSAWNPFERLSPAAVATLKQLKQENPGMTVEEYAPIFKISPDALRRILKSKWMPTAEQEAARTERWKRRGKSVWQAWEEKGMVETRKTKMKMEERVEMREREREQKGFVVSRGLNLKNRIL
ncbi:Required for respiratory growth protein 9 mitochondrial [Orbilia blumenaviensis]|uniref:Required for respiratory growth protein 9, mitochondrial n=1 Tax=Orbilia blumenaviensis TaxID=1796055 RepID=A0AAV9VEF0_9PEZI